MAQKIKNKNIRFGFGGMAKIGEGTLPAEAILAEHYRLGSTSVILSRTFRNEVGDNKEKVDLVRETKKIRDAEQMLGNWSKDDFEKNRLFVKQKVKEIVSRINNV